MSKMTGGTARMLSRRPTPASQSRPAATQNSRMALPPAALFAVRRSELEHVRLCLKHVSPAYSVRSPPPFGEGLGVGVRQRIAARPPPRRFAPTLPTRGRVKSEFAAGADFH